MSDYILSESGDKILGEDGGGILSEQSTAIYEYSGAINGNHGIAGTSFIATDNHLQACTFIFPAKGLGPGTQTVTGVVDSNGNQFLGAVVIFHGNSILNTIEQYFRISIGVDDGILPRSIGVDETQSLGLKTTTGGLSGQHSVFSEHAQFFFGGDIYREAKISAIRLGEFDLTYDLNLITGDSIMVTVLGGTDLQYAIGNNGIGGVIPTGFAPVAVLLDLAPYDGFTPSTSGPASWFGHGWAAKDSGQATSAINVNDNTALRFQSQSQTISGIVNGSITDFGTISFSSNFNSSFTGYLALGSINAKVITIDQPPVPGVQEIVTGLNNQVAFFSSIGSDVLDSVLSDKATLTYGVMDATRQTMFWGGEITQNTSAAPLGAKLIANDKLLAFGDPNGTSTSFTAVAVANGFDVFRSSILINWTRVDGVARKIHILALGDSPQVNPDTSFGSITVTKITSPVGDPNSFNFQSNELSPGQFILSHGQSIVFNNLLPGTYSIAEEGQAGWATTYDVSNGSPIDAITVDSGENVTITVVNTISQQFTGLYYIKKNKTNDSIYFKIEGLPPSNTELVDVKIPDPFVVTGLIGDE